MREGSLYRMWYTGYEEEGRGKLGYATSPDGITWTRYINNPIYDEHWIEDIIVVKHDGRYYMFTEGSPKGSRIDLLTSPDGID